MATDRQTPCLYYVCAGLCKKGRKADHAHYCQHCNKYKPRERVRYKNRKKEKLEKNSIAKDFSTTRRISMRNKYQRLSKEEKKQARLDYKNSEYNQNKIYEKGNRLRIFGIIGMIYATLSFAIDFLYKGDIWNFLLDAALLIFCLIAYLVISDILDKQINKYLIERDKPKKNNTKKKNGK